MIIYYEQVHSEGFTVDTSFAFSEGDDKFNIKSFSGSVNKAGNVYVVSGKLDLDFLCPCDRCLNDVNLNILEDLIITLSPIGEYPPMEKNGEEGLSDKEAGMYVTPTTHFDLHELLREEAILLIPDKRLCKDDCKGICPDCGVDLNIEKCKCDNKIIDNPWSILDKLRKN